MALSKYGSRDWQAGWRVPFGVGEAWMPSAVMTDAAGAALGTSSNPLVNSAAQNTFTHIPTSTTTIVKTGPGTLASIIVNSLGTVASAVTVYDNTAASGAVISVINTLALSGSFRYDVQFSVGLTVVTTGSPDITVTYR